MPEDNVSPQDNSREPGQAQAASTTQPAQNTDYHGGSQTSIAREGGEMSNGSQGVRSHIHSAAGVTPRLPEQPDTNLRTHKRHASSSERLKNAAGADWRNSYFKAKYGHREGSVLDKLVQPGNRVTRLTSGPDRPGDAGLSEPGDPSGTGLHAANSEQLASERLSKPLQPP